MTVPGNCAICYGCLSGVVSPEAIPDIVRDDDTIKSDFGLASNINPLKPPSRCIRFRVTSASDGPIIIEG